MLRRTVRSYAARVMDLAEAVADVPSGSKLLVSGFGVTGQPHVLMQALADRGGADYDCVCESVGAPGHGIGQLFDRRQVRKVTCSFLGRNAVVKKMYVSGDIEIEFKPQGTLAECLRAGGAGIPAFYAPAGAGTWYEEHGFPTKYQPDGVHIDKMSEKKEVRKWDERWCCLETAIKGDFGFVKAWKADTMGNLVFKDNTVNFNKVIAAASKVTIAEVEEIVEPGELDPNAIVVPCIYVDRIVQVPKYKTVIEPGCLKLHVPAAAGAEPATLDKMTQRERIARRAAKELQMGMFVNLGVGIPCEAADYCPFPERVTLQGENGMLGIGPFPEKAEDATADVMSAARFPATRVPHTSYFDSVEAFSQIRGKHLDLTMLGGLEVSCHGDLANWLRPGSPTTGMGGAMELVTNGCRVVVTMTHVNKGGKPKILDQCNLPLTGKRCVDRVITDLAVFDISRDVHAPMRLVEIAEDTTVDRVRELTEANFVVADDLKTIEYA